MRAVSASSCMSLNLVAVFAASVTYASTRSFAEAAFRSVSSVMYVFLIQSEVEDSVNKRLRSSFTLATNGCASAASGCCICAAAAAGAVCRVEAEAQAQSAAAARREGLFMAAQ